MNKIRPSDNATAMVQGYLRCDECGAVAPLERKGTECHRCRAVLHARKPHAISHTWALLLTASFLLLPANLLPVMTVSHLGKGEPATIIDGVIQLAQADMWGIALIVLVASVLIPIGKIIGLIILLLSVQFAKTDNLKYKMRLFRLVQWIGRWSMLDIFVIGVLVALVRFGNLATISGQSGSTAFAGVVVFTMLAANSFDTRLIWDKRQQQETASDE